MLIRFRRANPFFKIDSDGQETPKRFASRPPILRMNIHEYQAKELLQKFDVATTRGKVASTLDEAEQIARELGDIEIVVKAQIHAGGRGKGAFKNGFKGGVHVRKSPKEYGKSRQRCSGNSGDAPDGAGGSDGEQSVGRRIRRHCARDLFCHPSIERQLRL